MNSDKYFRAQDLNVLGPRHFEGLAMKKFEERLEVKPKKPTHNDSQFSKELDSRLQEIESKDFTEDKLCLWEDYERRFGVNQHKEDEKSAKKKGPLALEFEKQFADEAGGGRVEAEGE